MGKWKKIIAVSIVLLMLVSAGTVYVLYKYGFFSNYGDMDGYYFDFKGADQIGICNVEMGETSLSNAVFTDIISVNTVSMTPTGSPLSKENRPVSHDNYLVAPSRVHTQLKNIQSKLFIEDDQGNKELAMAYSNSSDMENKAHSINYKQSIVYVADAGDFILISYYKHRMSDVYNHLNYHGSFWSADRDYASALIEKSTGLVHKLSGLWCGCTYEKYSGTNDVMPSIQYAGKIKGEDAFLINLERNVFINNDNSGMFHDKRGLVTIGIDDSGKITYKELITERNAGYGVEKDDDGNRITAYDKDTPYLGSEFRFYKNGIVCYYEMTGIKKDRNSYFSPLDPPLTVQYYLWFSETGEKRAVDKSEIIDVDGYLCSSATYVNEYFPVSCTRYASDGSLTNISYDTDEERYRVATEQSYGSCFYRDIGSSETMLYMTHKDFYTGLHDIDRVTLYPDCTFSVDSNIFGENILFIDGECDGFIIYDHRIFGKFSIDRIGHLNVERSISNKYTGFIISGDCLYCLEGNNLEIYNLTDATKTVKTFQEMDKLLYMYVNADGVFELEGSSSDGYLRGEMKGDGSFEFKKADLELDVVTKINNS